MACAATEALASTIDLPDIVSVPERVLFPATASFPVSWTTASSSALVAMAVAMAVYSASCSEPKTFLEGSPVTKLSLAVKFVVFV